MEKVKAKVIDEQERIKNKVLERIRLEKVIVKAMDGKKCIYRNGLGEEINTYTQGLDDLISLQVEPLKMFLNQIQSVEGEEVRIIAQALFNRAIEKIEEAVVYIDDNYGIIEIERVSYHQVIASEKILGVVYTPPDKKEAIHEE